MVFAITSAIVGDHNKHPLGCVAQLAWKCLFTPTFFHGWFWPI